MSTPLPRQTQPRWVACLNQIEYFVLLSILNTPRTGIEIFEELLRATDGKLILSPGTLYAALRQLLASELINIERSDLEVVQSEGTRRHYRATAKGRSHIVEMADWMRRELAAITEELNRPGAPPPLTFPGSEPPAPIKGKTERLVRTTAQKSTKLVPV